MVEGHSVEMMSSTAHRAPCMWKTAVDNRVAQVLLRRTVFAYSQTPLDSRRKSCPRHPTVNIERHMDRQSTKK